MRHSFICFAVLSLVHSPLIRAEDWPAWRGPRADGISRETGLLGSWPANGPKTLWSANVGIGFSTPIVVDGKLYMFALVDNVDALYAFDAASGKDLWKRTTESLYKGRRPNEMMGGWKGTRSSPVVEKERIYTFGPAGDLICREIADGKIVWHVNVLVETGAEPITWGCASNPLIEGDVIYVQGGKGGALCVAIDKKTGRGIWKSENGMAGYAQPVRVDIEGSKQLIVFGGEAVWALDAKTGKTIWSRNWKTDYDVNAATPIFHNGQLLLTSAYSQGHCEMLGLSAGGQKTLWSNRDVTSKFQPPILDGEVIYANSEGKVRCIGWKDGKVRWTAPDNINQGGSMLRVGGRLIMLSERGKLILAEATPQAYKKISECKPLDGNQIWSAPMICNGRLYIKGTEELVCMAIK